MSYIKSRVEKIGPFYLLPEQEMSTHLSLGQTSNVLVQSEPGLK